MPDHTQNLVVETQKNIAILQFSGDLDAGLVQKLRPAIEIQLQKSDANSFIADIHRVRFLDSNGVGLFVSLLKRAHARKGKLALVGAQGQPLSVLKMVGLNETLVSFHATLEQAQDFLNQPNN